MCPFREWRMKLSNKFMWQAICSHSLKEAGFLLDQIHVKANEKSI